MSLLTAGALAIVTLPSLWGQETNTNVERSKELLTRWAPVVAASRPTSYAGSVQNVIERSGSLDYEFEKINGGCDASLTMLETLLQGNDKAARRSAAAVIGEIRFGIGNETKDWHQFRSKELQLAAKYVLDSDQVTAVNATTAFISLLDGEPWDKWEDYQAEWVQALATAEGPRARNLCELFAFTPVPISEAIPGLYRLFKSTDPEQSSWALCGLARAQMVAPAELREVVLADVGSKSAAKRASAYRNLERLGVFLWDGFAPNKWLQNKIDREPYFMLTSWFGSTMPRGGQHANQVRQQQHEQVLGVLSRGLNDGNHVIRLSSAKALIPIGREVDDQLGSGSSIRLCTNKEEVARLLIQASKAVAKDDPALAKEARDLADGFDRPRTIR